MAPAGKYFIFRLNCFSALAKFFQSPPESFSNVVAKLLYEIAHLHLTSSRWAHPSKSLTGPALIMALASTYAVSGLSQTELCFSIYRTQIGEHPITVIPLAECVPGDFFLDRWVWLDPSTDAMLRIPLEDRILDKRGRKPNLLSTKTVPLDSILPDGRMLLLGLPPRSLTLPPCHQGQGATMNAFMSATGRHNACKGAKTDAERKTLLICQLCASDPTSAEDIYDHLFRSCQHPLLSKRGPSQRVSCWPLLCSRTSTSDFFRFSYVCYKRTDAASAWVTGIPIRSPNLTMWSNLLSSHSEQALGQ